MESVAAGATTDLAAFIRSFLGQNFDGYIVLFEGKTKKSRFFTAGRLAALCDEVARLREWTDVYVGLATQQDDLGPKSRGRAKSVVTVGGFFADIDFGLSKESAKAYPPDEATALQVLRAFDHQPTAIVRTGNGLHVHWAFPQSLILKSQAERARHQERHRAFARTLAALFDRHGYEIDNVSDLARVYRAPGTLNHKSVPPKSVEILEFNPDARVPMELVSPSQAEDRRAVRFEDHRPRAPANHERIRQGCAWYRHHTGEGAADSPEPDWYAATSITARTVDGQAIFHAYSRRHPNYDERTAQTKFRRSLEEAGPRTCRAIREDGNERYCSVCPHWDQISSPIQLGAGYDPGLNGPIALGYTQQGQYALLDQNRKIIVLLSGSQLLAFGVLIGLADSAFWESRFPGGKGGCNATEAGEALIRACRVAGPFDPLSVRGRGVWLEGDQLVVNFGEPPPPGLRNLYLCFAPLKIRAPTGFPTARLRALLELFPWRRPRDADLVLGWMAMAPVCGALKSRPHAFIYGPPNSGKTTLHKLASELLHPVGLPADGQSSEAGIRQMLGPDSRPIIIDEFETDQRVWRLAGVLRLARSAYSADLPVLRGTQDGHALQYSIRTTMLFSAVNVAGMTPADETRILTLELQAHQNADQVRRLIAKESQFFAELGPQWCGWMAANAPHLARAIDMFEVVLSGANSRLRLNIGTLLGGAFVAIHGRPPNESEAADWAADHSDTIAYQGQAHERNDAQEALDRLFAHPVRDDRGVVYPLAHFIAVELAALSEERRSNDLRESARITALHDLRIIIDGTEPGLMVRNGSSAIDSIFKETRWANGAWRRALLQIPGAFSPKNPVRFPNSTGKPRAVGLPLEVIPPPYATPADEVNF